MSLSFLALAVTVSMSVAAQPPELRREQLMAALQEGGYTILVRHARTDRSVPNKETPGYAPALRVDQRNLTPEGEADVRLMAEVVRAFRIPIGEVISSPVYRCRETADAFGTASITMALRVFPTTSETAALVAAAPRQGTNRVIVTHHFVIEEYVPGIDPGGIGESEAAVVRPAGDGTVTLVGRITLDDWPYLARLAASHARPAATSEQPTRAHAPPAAHPSAPERGAVIPATRAGTLASRYIEVFNSADETRMRSFIESSLVAVPGRTTDMRVEAYRRLLEQHGQLAVTRVVLSQPDTLHIGIRSKSGDVLLQVVAAPEPSTRARSITFTGGSGGHR